MQQSEQQHNQQFYIDCSIAGFGGSLAKIGYKQYKKSLVTVGYNLGLSASILTIGVGITLLAWGTYKMLNQQFDEQVIDIKENINAKKLKNR